MSESEGQQISKPSSFPLLYLRTLSHLRLEQILYRGLYAIRAYGPRFLRLNARPVPKDIEWTPLNYREPFLIYPWFKSADIIRGLFRFLNDSADFGSQIDWQARGKKRLWRYNLNYFQYLHSPGGLVPDTAIPLMMDWITHSPPGTLDAWDPFPISLRIVNWIKYISQTEISEEKCRPICRSAYQQTLWLEKSLERHLLGNHLFKNSKALFFAGLFFKGKDAERWLTKGLRFQ